MLKLNFYNFFAQERFDLKSFQKEIENQLENNLQKTVKNTAQLPQ